jgi:hypothetical protein
VKVVGKVGKRISILRPFSSEQTFFKIPRFGPIYTLLFQHPKVEHGFIHFGFATSEIR